MKRLQPKPLLVGLLLALIVAIFVAIASGAVAVPLKNVVRALLFMDSSQQYYAIIVDIRLPRILLAAIVGGVLAISGAVMQGLFRNPLADPSVIGVTAGASLGASIMIVLVSSYASFWWGGLPLISFGAFLGGSVAVLFVYRLASGVYGTSVPTMLLAGIGITALSTSINSFLEFYANDEMLRRISLWKMGGLDGANYSRLILAAMIGLLVFALIPRYSQALNALLLGESEAKHLGIHTEHLKRYLIIIVAAGVGVAVALAGVIVFVGLVVPHILRLLIGPDHRFLLPASALGGATLLVVSDNVARVLLAPTELPVGLITSIIGVPFFISLLKRRYIYGVS